MIKQAKLDHWQAVCDAASKGPWRVDYEKNDGEYGNGEDSYSSFDEPSSVQLARRALEADK